MNTRYDAFDRMSRNDEQGGGFMLGLLAGAVIGTGIGLLFAPKAGAELRNDLSQQANDLANSASEQYRRAAATANEYAEKGREMYNSAAEKGREAYNNARSAVNRGSEQAEQYARDTVRDAADKVSDRAAGFANEVSRS